MLQSRWSVQHQLVPPPRPLQPAGSLSRRVCIHKVLTVQAMRLMRPVCRCVHLGWRSGPPRSLAVKPYASHSGLQMQNEALKATAEQHKRRQTLDYTSLVACCNELKGTWVPSKVEEVGQVKLQ